MKKLIALLLCCVIAVGLFAVFAGCTAKTNDAPQASPSASDTQQTAPSTVPDDAQNTPAPSNAENAKGFDVVDVNGNTVHFDKQPETFVVANYIFNFLLVGGGESLDKVVGLTKDGWEDTRYGEYTALTEAFPEILNIDSIGGYHDDVLDRELILELNPDCLLIGNSQYTENETSIPTWEAAGIKIVVLDYHKMKLENHINSTKALGMLLGREEIAGELCSNYENGINLVQERISTISEDQKNVKVYIELGNQGVGIIGNSYDGMLWGAMADNVGAENIAAGRLPESYGPLDMEYILEQNPDKIIIGGAIWSGDNGGDQMRMGFTIDETLAQTRLAGFAGREWFKALTATKNGEIYGVDHGSLRNILDYTFTEYMAQIVYPDAFADIDPQAEYEAVLKKYLPELTAPGTFMIKLEA